MPRGARSIKYGGRFDLEYLYETGFVDTDKFTLNDWVEAFKDSLQKDGTYLLNEAQWMAKKKYRYDGPIDPPFDLNSLREGLWEPVEFEKFLNETILPSISVPEKIFRDSMEKTKARMVVNGKIAVDQQLKLGLKQIFDAAPSPRRYREVSMAQALAKANTQGTKTPLPTVPSRSAQQVSGFSKGPAASQNAVDQLSKLLWKK